MGGLVGLGGLGGVFGILTASGEEAHSLNIIKQGMTQLLDVADRSIILLSLESPGVEVHILVLQ